jgi:hypothetical protein
MSLNNESFDDYPFKKAKAGGFAVGPFPSLEMQHNGKEN